MGAQAREMRRLGGEDGRGGGLCGGIYEPDLRGIVNGRLLTIVVRAGRVHIRPGRQPVLSVRRRQPTGAHLTSSQVTGTALLPASRGYHWGGACPTSASLKSAIAAGLCLFPVTASAIAP